MKTFLFSLFLIPLLLSGMRQSAISKEDAFILEVLLSLSCDKSETLPGDCKEGKAQERLDPRGKHALESVKKGRIKDEAQKIFDRYLNRKPLYPPYKSKRAKQTKPAKK